MQVVDDVASLGGQPWAVASHANTGTFVHDRQGTADVVCRVVPRLRCASAARPGAGSLLHAARLSRWASSRPLSGQRPGQDVFVYDTARDALSRVTTTGDGNLWPYLGPRRRAHRARPGRTQVSETFWWARTTAAAPPRNCYRSGYSIDRSRSRRMAEALAFTQQDRSPVPILSTLPLDVEAESPRRRAQGGSAQSHVKTGANEGVPAFFFQMAGGSPTSATNGPLQSGTAVSCPVGTLAGGGRRRIPVLVARGLRVTRGGQRGSSMPLRATASSPARAVRGPTASARGANRP